MPRRPRPAHRTPPGEGGAVKRHNNAAPKPNAAPKIRVVDPESESEGRNDSGHGEEDDSSKEFEEGSSQGSGMRNEREESDNDLEVDEEEDADAPRVAQWVEDDEDFFEEESEEEAEEKMTIEKNLQDNLHDLPLGALRRAQQVLSRAEPESDSESETDADNASDDKPDVQDVKGKGKEKVEWSIKPRTDISKRSSKHAPTEVTSKRPVTRKRTVVEVPKIVPRDPRFLPTAGEFDASKFQKSYNFLADNHKKELQTLRETLKQARKMLASSPRELRSEREHEVYRLEQAVKRTESMVNRDRLERVEREALSKVNKEEQEKRKQGKGQWFLKKTDKQQLVMKARYESLAKEGGQRAVKKAIEKKQKKVSQKEKRSRPYAKGEEGVSRKRAAETDSGWPRKRQR